MMRLFAALVLATAMIFTATATVQARDLTAVERTALADRVASFKVAMQTKVVRDIITVTPPKIWHHIAKQAGVDPEALREMVIKQTGEVMADFTFERVEMRFEDAEFKTTPDGDPYALVPTEFAMSSPATGRVEVSSHTLAILDEGTWYLMRVNDIGQLAILRQVYPGFADVEFPSGTMKATK